MIGPSAMLDYEDELDFEELVGEEDFLCGCRKGRKR